MSKTISIVLKEKRWPIKFGGIDFPDRLAFLIYLIKKNVFDFPETGFLHSNYYFIRAALEQKFDRHFSKYEIYKIIIDKSWQWRKPLQNKFEKKD